MAVVIPCLDDGATLRAAVDSARAQEPVELVVVDDGSGDAETLAVMRGLESEGVRVLHQQNAGLAAARMAGVAATSAPYVFPLDADDELVAGALGPLADALDAAPDAAAAWGDVELHGDVSVRYSTPDGLDPWRLTYLNELPVGSLFRRTALLEAGGWQLRGGYEDWDLWLALAERGCRGVRVPGPAHRYRVHGGRMWRDAATRHDAIMAELARRHAALFDRRAAGRRASDAPLRLKLVLPLVERLPISSRGRIALANLAARPLPALRTAVGIRRARYQRSRGKHR